MYFYSALGLLKVVTLGKFAEWTNCRSLKSLLEQTVTVHIDDH